MGRDEMGVAEEFLDTAEVGSVVEQMGGEAVAEFVGTDFEADGGMPQIFLKEVADRPHRQAPPEFAEKERAFVNTCGLAIALNGAQGRAADGTEPILAAFAGDAEGFVGVVDVSDVELDEFVKAEPGAVEKFEDGGVPLGSPCGRALGAIGLKREGKAEEFVDL